jgi:hypothetical protein
LTLSGGRVVRLKASNGIIETTDAEVALELDRLVEHGTLKREERVKFVIVT